MSWRDYDDGRRVWTCPACGALMGVTWSPGQMVYCSWGDDGNDCERFGWGRHPEPGQATEPTTVDARGRKWTHWIHDGKHPQPGTG